MNEPIKTPWIQTDLVTLIERGRILHDISGATPNEVLASIVYNPQLPGPVNRNELLQAVLERETLMPTSIGKGIALPHPRNPIITDIQEQFVSIAFPEHPVDWKALDNKPVHTVLLIVSASAKLHLHTLSWINFFCQQEGFRELLERRTSQEELTTFIQHVEAAWT
ncbi:MAG: PTS sugar transporter subunit IIA [Treponema sp.]|jgi:PTS system nitrogen regulatory IIA component|nr:PTS sugar transporter subunit IIA [Treponema sp.]